MPKVKEAVDIVESEKAPVPAPKRGRPKLAPLEVAEKPAPKAKKAVKLDKNGEPKKKKVLSELQLNTLKKGQLALQAKREEKKKATA